MTIKQAEKLTDNPIHWEGVIESFKERRDWLRKEADEKHSERKEILLAAAQGDKKAQAKSDELLEQIEKLESDLVDTYDAIELAEEKRLLAQGLTEKVAARKKAKSIRADAKATIEAANLIQEHLEALAPLVDDYEQKCNRLIQGAGLQSNGIFHRVTGKRAFSKAIRSVGLSNSLGTEAVTLSHSAPLPKTVEILTGTALQKAEQLEKS